MTKTLNELTELCHQRSKDAGWWNNPITVDTVPRCLMLIVSEIAEAMEADRKQKMDSHLPLRKGIEVELADAIIRICDLAGFLKLDLERAVEEKLEYNRKRQDHNPTNREKRY